jgi:hypothetical protein
MSIAYCGDNLLGMNTKPHIAEIDAQIAKLQNARAVLLALDSTPVKATLGRAKGSITKKAAPKKHELSEAATAKIAAAQRKRWAARRNSMFPR